MKVAAAQFNSTVGALSENRRRMLEWVEQARSSRADVVLFPELCLPGYPPRDLLDRPSFVKQVVRVTAELVAAVPADVTVIFGTVGAGLSGPGLPLSNDAVVARGGREIGRARKQLLPSYDVFDEVRYFRPGAGSFVTELCGERVSINICEDAWADSAEMAGRYLQNPLRALAGGTTDVLLNLTASPFTLAKWGRREVVFRDVALRYGVDVVMVNQVGANDELIFDGTSVAWSKRGELLGHAPSFEETLWTADVGRTAPAQTMGLPPQASPEAAAYSALVLGVRDYARKCGFGRAVLGLSGGVDSALTAVIAVDALGRENVLGLALPTRNSSAGSLTDAAALAHNLGIGLQKIDIDPIFQAYINGLSAPLDALALPGPLDVTLENLQARVRGATLMAVSNRTGALVLTTGNKSELAVGYCTLYGDMAGGLAVISDVPKTMVYRLARYVNRERERIPRASIEKAPSAELRPDQTDQDSLPPYEVLDPILELYVEDQASPAEIVARGHDRQAVERVVQLVRGAEYKRRQAAPGLILTRKAFGSGRRMPVAGRLEEK